MPSVFVIDSSVFFSKKVKKLQIAIVYKDNISVPKTTVSSDYFVQEQQKKLDKEGKKKMEELQKAFGPSNKFSQSTVLAQRREYDEEGFEEEKSEILEVEVPIDFAGALVIDTGFIDVCDVEINRMGEIDTDVIALNETRINQEKPSIPTKEQMACLNSNLVLCNPGPELNISNGADIPYQISLLSDDDRGINVSIDDQTNLSRQRQGKKSKRKHNTDIKFFGNGHSLMRVISKVTGSLFAFTNGRISLKSHNPDGTTVCFSTKQTNKAESGDKTRVEGSKKKEIERFLNETKRILKQDIEECVIKPFEEHVRLLIETNQIKQKVEKQEDDMPLSVEEQVDELSSCFKCSIAGYVSQYMLELSKAGTDSLSVVSIASGLCSLLSQNLKVFGVSMSDEKIRNMHDGIEAAMNKSSRNLSDKRMAIRQRQGDKVKQLYSGVNRPMTSCLL